jgi:hypothetical protein
MLILLILIFQLAMAIFGTLLQRGKRKKQIFD